MWRSINHTNILKHILKCEVISKIKIGEMVEGIDFVICKICNFHAQNLGIHLRKIHDLDSREYCIKNRCKSTSAVCFEKYKDARFLKFDGYSSYTGYAKLHNIDLSEWRAKLSKAVSKSIMNNPLERTKRSKRMTKLAEKQKNDPAILKLRSDVAKKTSSRPEILIARTEQLRRWRQNNPDDFYNKCTKKMLGSYRSKPEGKLFEFISKLPGFSFNRNQFVMSRKYFYTKSGKKQIDMADKKKRIYIEFDGPLHFIPRLGEEKLRQINLKDEALDQYMFKHKWILIRVSFDQFVYRNTLEKCYFKQDCLDQLIEILHACKPGIYKIGESYDKYKKY